MIRIFNIEIIEKNKSKKLTQWDADRYIKITAPGGAEVSHADFAYEHDIKAIRREVVLSDGIMMAKIPNSLLQRCGKMRVWLVCNDTTIYGDILVVVPKSRDDGYVLPDDEDEVYNYTSLEKRIAEIEKNGGGADGKSAYQYAQDGGYTGTEEEFVQKLAQENPSKEEFDKISEEIKTSKADSIIESAEGSLIIATDSTKNAPVDLEIYGKSEQTQLSGNQLLKPITDATYRGITAKMVDGYVVFTGTATGGAADFYVCGKNGVYEETGLEPGTYCISSDIEVDGVSFLVVRDDATIVKAVSSVGKTATFEIEDGRTYRMFYRILAETTLSDLPVKVMLNSGDTALPWEPYCGGVPSPNPDYPQEIVNAGTYDETTGKYAVTVKATGKNLTDVFYEKVEHNGIVITNNHDGSWTVNGTAGTGGSSPVLISSKGTLNDMIAGRKFVLSGGLPDGSDTTYYMQIWGRIDKNTTFVAKDYGNGVTKTFPDIVINWNIAMMVKEGVTLENEKIYPMVRFAEITDDTFEPYKEITTTVYLDEPLRKGDVICKKDGVWGVERHRATIIVDGTKTPERLDTWKNENGFQISNPEWDPVYLSGYAEIADILCASLIANKPDLIANGTAVNVIGQGKKNIYLAIADITTTEALQAHLTENPITVEYPLATPVFTPFEDQTIFDGLSMQYPVTVLSNDFSTDMAVEYIADTKAYIDKKFAELAAAMV